MFPLFTHSHLVEATNDSASPDRGRRIIWSLEALSPFCEMVSSPAIEISQLESVHSGPLLARLLLPPPVMFDFDTHLGPLSLNSILHSCGSSRASALAALSTGPNFCLVDGGHHAGRAFSSGGCIVNPLAFAAMSVIESGLERIAIVDFDVHHGQGTQDIFYDSRLVLTTSIHNIEIYPLQGFHSERGEGAGYGSNINVPLRCHSGDREFLEGLELAIIPSLKKFSPQLLIVAAGFDAHEADPLGLTRVSHEGFYNIAKLLLELDIPISFHIQGGYSERGVKEGLGAILQALGA